jgi:DNA (cytosine-5)-methyltransferase 1
VLKLLDLFSGIGGFSLGLERTGGFETVAFCEIDKFCQKVLRKHWPNVRQYTDIKTLTAAQLKADGITVDAICGGFPCQDISTAGGGAGMGEGTRSGLWSEYARLIGELRPRYVIVENVSALLGRGLNRVLGDLAQIGYDAEWHCIPASAVGAPHRRDRVWIVAHSVCGGGGERCVCIKRENGCDIGEWSSTQLEQSSEASTPVAHADIAELQIINEIRDSRQTASRIIEGGELERAYSESGAKQWRVEPNVGRVAHGVSARVDRLKSLGNAVVPQIPELIGRAILSAEAASPQEE